MKINNFITKTNEALKDMPNEAIYYVDYIFNGYEADPTKIADIAKYPELWGKDMDEPLIAIKDLKLTADMVSLMGLDKGKPTLKITLPNKVSLIKFGSSEDEYEQFQVKGSITIDVIGKCNINEWNGHITSQVFIEDYEIIGRGTYIF